MKALPKFASNNRQAGTPEENKAFVQGSLAYFGTYSVDEAAKTVTVHIESCSGRALGTGHSTKGSRGDRPPRGPGNS